MTVTETVRPRCVLGCLAALIALGTPGCLASHERGAPLYVARAHPYAVTEVAQLYGEVAQVDGRDVSGLGPRLELLPGCHIVTTRTSLGHRDLSQNAVATNLPKRDFAIHMQANRNYVIEYDLATRTGNGGVVAVSAREQDAAGHITATLEPASNRAELDRCRATTSHPQPG
jgi:hypothetical protein